MAGSPPAWGVPFVRFVVICKGFKETAQISLLYARVFRKSFQSTVIRKGFKEILAIYTATRHGFTEILSIY